MSAVEIELNRAATADRSAISRALTKLRKTADYQEMTVEEQSIAESITKQDVMEKR
jgi:hypothetical protein